MGLIAINYDKFYVAVVEISDLIQNLKIRMMMCLRI
jgi:hypothetical protein